MKDIVLTCVVGLFVVAVLTSPVACSMYESKLVAAAIANGVDPVSARCGISGVGHSVICATRTQ